MGKGGNKNSFQVSKEDVPKQQHYKEESEQGDTPPRVEKLLS